MASIEVRKGMLVISAMVLDEATGKQCRKRKSTGLRDTKENRKLVEKKIIPELERKIALGEVKIEVKVPTIKSLGDEFIAMKRKESVRGYTVDDYEAALELHVYPLFRDRTADSVTTAELEKWQAGLIEKGLKAKRIQNVRIPFNQIFELAVKHRLILRNPFDAAVKITAKKSKQEQSDLAEKLKSFMKCGIRAEEIMERLKVEKDDKDPFSEAEIRKLFAAASGMIKNYVQIAFFTAMRPSEQIALTWDQVNLEERYILVVGAITGKETEEEETLNKSMSSVRIVHLCDQAVKAFEEQYKLTGGKGGRVFLNQYGKPYQSIQSIRNKLFKKLQEKAGVRPRKLYTLRHSFASINLSKNRLPILFVSQQMGHKDASVTLQAYSAYIPDSKEEVNVLVNKAFEGFAA